MLNKLMKYEWKDISKMGRILILALLAFTLIGSFVLYNPGYYRVMDQSEFGPLQIVLMVASMISLVLYIILLAGAIYGILIYVGIRFYKSMFGQEGYLTHTLPLETGKIFWGKTVISSVWIMIIELLVLVSIGILLFCLGCGMFQFTNPDITLSSFLKEGWEAFRRGLANGLLEELNIGHWIIFIVFVVGVSPFLSAINLFAALTIGQMSKKHKVAMGIFTYIGINILSSIIQSIFSTMDMITASSYSGYQAAQFMDQMMGNGEMRMLVSIAISVMLYFISRHILTNKLNLE